jgi:biopolymer transport protein TolR
VRRRRSGRLHLNAEINVVSLIDVMMLLLVIFMITAPLMQGGVDVKLPAADAKPLESKSPIVITIDRAGTIFVNGDRVRYGEFAASFKALIGANVKQGVTVKADRATNWDNVAKVLAVIQAAGVTMVGMATETESPPR